VWRRFLPERLSILTLSPGMHASTVEAALSQLDGAVLRVFGSGTLMQEPALQRALLNATDRGCRIIAVSCCEAGGVHQGAYASDGLLWSSGVESGGTATAEAALMRLWLELSERDRKQHPETKLVAAI
jgi:L-asparaginase